MIDNTPIIMPIPRNKTFRFSVLVNEEEVKSKVYESDWTKKINNGIGFFRLVLINTGGVYDNSFEEGQEVSFKADRIGGTTQKFLGRIDYIKKRIEKEGQFLDIEGRHSSWESTETFVCYEDEKDGGAVLKDLFNTFLPSYDTSEIPISTGETFDANWSYIPFWTCVAEVLRKIEYDGYITDDLVVKIFAENSIQNVDEAIVDGQNFVRSEEVGSDNYYEKDTCTCMGSDENGIPVLYTAGSGNREIFVKGSSQNQEAQVQSIAEGTLAENLTRPTQGKFVSSMILDISPGDNILYLIPRQSIANYFKIIQYTHRFGTQIGMPQTETLIEKEPSTTSYTIQNQSVAIKRDQSIINPNKMLFSYNFLYADSTNMAALVDCVVEGGALKLESGKSTGTATSNVKNTLTTGTISNVELRVSGRDLESTTYQVKVNNAASATTIVPNVLKEIAGAQQGTELSLITTLTSDANNPEPQIDSCAVLYK